MQKTTGTMSTKLWLGLALFLPLLLAAFCAIEQANLRLIKDMVCPFMTRMMENSSFCTTTTQPSSQLIRTLTLTNGRQKQYSLKKAASHEVGYFVEPLELWSLEETDENDDIIDGGLVLRPLPADQYDSQENWMEAVSTLHAAVELKKLGRMDKAQRLLEHALALAPTHPDVLNEMGLFMETVGRDVIKAQTMYTRAAVYNPWHAGAIQNRLRTLPLVEEVDNRLLQNIDKKRNWFLKIPRFNPSLRRAMRESYFAHVYHTVALEGNTMTLAQTRSVLETRVAVGGKSIVEHNEILGMDAALRFLNQSVVHRIGEIDMQDILEIHRRVLGFVDPIQAGVFRNTQVYVGKFTPVAPDRVLREMDDFLEWLNADDTLSIHPVELAALAHYKFVVIHPFVDGNGRTARLLMNLILMQAGFPPVIIRVEDRLSYYETLTLANEGDLRPFIRFIAATTDRTLEHYLNSVIISKQGSRDTECPDKRAEIDDQHL